MMEFLWYGKVHWLWVLFGAFVGIFAAGLCCAAKDWADYRRDCYPSIDDAEQGYERPRRVK